MIHDTLMTEVEGAPNAQEVLVMMCELSKNPAYKLDLKENLYTLSAIMDWCVEEISKGRSGDALAAVKDALEQGDSGSVFMLVDDFGFAEMDKTDVAYLFGLTDCDLALPAPFGLLPDDSLYAPEGWRWARTENGLGLFDDNGRPACSVDTSRNCLVVLAGPDDLVSTIDLQKDALLSDVMRTAELETLDELHLMPHDRGDGCGWDAFLTYACNKASRRIWEGMAPDVHGVTDAFSVPLMEVMAAQYAYYYTDGVRTNPGFREAYREAAGTMRLSDLVEAAALSHARADIDWAEDHFQERGSDGLVNLAVDMADYERGSNEPLEAQARDAASGAPAPSERGTERGER